MKSKFILMAFIFCVLVVQARILNVPMDQSTIQTAINAADDGDTVLVAEGTYFENINYKGKAITVASHFILDGDTSHISKTIIDGSKPVDPNMGTVVTMILAKDTTSVLCGLKITGGTGTVISAGNIKVRSGGGIHMNGGKVMDNIISGNKIKFTGEGGGAGIITVPPAFSVYKNANVVIRNNQIHHNTINATSMVGGGGIHISPLYGLSIVENNRIHDNIATSTAKYKVMGGGLYIQKGYANPAQILIRNNYIFNNEMHCAAAFGGGMYIVYPREQDEENLATNIPIEVTNNIIINNYSQDKGGGIAVWNMSMAYGLTQQVVDPIISNNTIFGNKANDGSGIYNYDAKSLIFNNILWDDLSVVSSKEMFNEDINYPGGWNKPKNDGVILANYNTIQNGYEGEGNIALDPQLNSNDFTLSKNSPCIDQGVEMLTIDGLDYFTPKMDFNADERPYSGNASEAIDMGAIESHFDTSPSVIHVPAEVSTIQGAIDAADDGDIVLVSEGRYYENINYNGKAITVASHFILDGDTSHISKTIIDGSKPVKVDTASVVLLVSGEDSTSVLKGFTITGGLGTKMYNQNFEAFTKNGGGICIRNGGKVENNIIVNNHVEATSMIVAGGGIGAYPSSDMVDRIIIRNNEIRMNSVTSDTYAQGAGILTGSELGYTLVENNIIYKNVSRCTGSWKANAGGIMLASWQPWNCKLIVRNNKIINNEIQCSSAQGGGIFLTFPPYIGDYKVTKATIEIYNNIIANNTSTDYAGGVAFWDQNSQSNQRINPFVALYNNTLINNLAPRFGVGLLNFQMRILIYNNLFKDELVRNATEIYNGNLRYPFVPNNEGIIYSKANFVSDNSFGDDNIWGDPMVDSLTYALTDNSPCIGKGVDSVQVENVWYVAPPYDFNDSMRSKPAHTIPDIGAIESALMWPVKTADIQRNQQTVWVSPNPATHQLQIRVQLEKQQPIQLSIYNVLGQLEQVLINEVRAPGEYLVPADISGLKPGVYFVVLQSKGKVTTSFIKQ